MAANSNWGEALFTIQYETGETSDKMVSGRDSWTLEALIAAGKKGCTPFDTPGPRWSAYVFNLRQQGVPIETVTEAHDGPFAGSHARYVLRARVSLYRGCAA